MRIVQKGAGPAVVVVPGLDGHWQWIAPAITALSRSCLVTTFSLPGERDSGTRIEEARGVAATVDYVIRGMDRAGVDRACLCGVSFGGWIAIATAAAHPDRVNALVLVSTPSPHFILSGKQARYLAAPRRSLLPFVMDAPRRHAAELRRVYPTWNRRLAFTVPHLARVLSTGFSPSRMAARIRSAQDVPFDRLCHAVAVPTLVVTGESGMDAVVPAEDTLRYLEHIPHASSAVLMGTGHLGTVTRSGDFARMVSAFLGVDEDASRQGRQTTMRPRPVRT